MMKNRKLSAAVLIVSLMSQSVFGSTQAIAQDNPTKLSYHQLLGAMDGNPTLVKSEIKNYQVRVASGEMSEEQSLKVLTQSMIDQKVNLADVDAFVQSVATPAEYRNFKRVLMNSLKGVQADQVSPEEMEAIMNTAMEQMKVDGLAWEGGSYGVLILCGAVFAGMVVWVLRNGFKPKTVYTKTVPTPNGYTVH